MANEEFCYCGIKAKEIGKAMEHGVVVPVFKCPKCGDKFNGSGSYGPLWLEIFEKDDGFEKYGSSSSLGIIYKVEDINDGLRDCLKITGKLWYVDDNFNLIYFCNWEEAKKVLKKMAKAEKISLNCNLDEFGKKLMFMKLK